MLAAISAALEMPLLLATPQLLTSGYDTLVDGCCHITPGYADVVACCRPVVTPLAADKS